MAERVGFEPTVRFKTDNALAGRPIRPLWHLSWEDFECTSGLRATTLGPQPLAANRAQNHLFRHYLGANRTE
jgi:hypothetical protein